ncbi:retrovirus-related Pol polyprotein from transposon opus [Nephila pilipes]|uniref:Retrovirus-related Pol polyprotein from transposon opus n=1 Tax=Nephila pilipes TaxID=299642 RepID=A0A8X6MZP1_NEPPI|nr:retrovirus-related Pol polyprotein from transposon opus [Nephila pilipes]
MDEEWRWRKGLKPSQKCLFRGRICPQNRLPYFQNLRYGNCITFNEHNKEMEAMEYFKLCDLTNTTQMCYLDNVLETVSKNAKFCDCPQPYALSRIEAINENNYDAIANELVNDEELKQLMQNNSSLKFKPSTLPSGKTLWCDISTPKIRPYIPQKFRLQIFELMHGFAHPSVKYVCK